MSAGAAGAEIQERRPTTSSARVVGLARVGREQRGHGVGVAERGGQVQRTLRQVGRPRESGIDSRVVTSNGGVEDGVALARLGRLGILERVLQRRPAGVAGFPRDNKLRLAQGQRRREPVARREKAGARQLGDDAHGCVGAAVRVRAPQLLGAFALLLQIERRTSGIRHGTTFHSCRSPLCRLEDSPLRGMPVRLRPRWAPPFPRTGCTLDVRQKNIPGRHLRPAQHLQRSTASTCRIHRAPCEDSEPKHPYVQFKEEALRFDARAPCLRTATRRTP